MIKELILRKGIKLGKSAVGLIKKVVLPIFEKEVNNAEKKLWEMCNKACDKSFQTDSETHFKNADNSDLISEIIDTSFEFGQNILQPAGSILDIHKYPTVPSTIFPHDRDNGQFLVNTVEDPTTSSKTYDMIKYFTLSQSHIFDKDFSYSSMKTFQYLTNLQQLEEMIMATKRYHVFKYFLAMTNNNTKSGEVSGRRNKVILESQRSIMNEKKPKYATVLQKDCDEVSGRRNKVIPQSQGSIMTDPRGGIYYQYYLIFQSDLTSQDGHSIIPRTFDDLVNTLSQGNWKETYHRQSLLEYIMSVSSLSRDDVLNGVFHFYSVGQNDDLPSVSAKFKEKLKSNEAYKQGMAVDYRLVVVTSEVFENAMRQSQISEYSLTFSNYFPHNCRMFIAIPVYKGGFINRRDEKDRR